MKEAECARRLAFLLGRKMVMVLEGERKAFMPS